MKVILLLPVGEVPAGLLDSLAAGMETEFDAVCRRAPQTLDPSFALHEIRRQYHSTEILARMVSTPRADCWRVLGVTAVDLYIPILTFVFGEAQVSGSCALVSTHRLRQEYYGLPADEELLAVRLLKESVHELGHTLGLTHCVDYECAMAPSHAVEWIDLKGTGLCASCRDMALDPPSPR